MKLLIQLSIVFFSLSTGYAQTRDTTKASRSSQQNSPQQNSPRQDSPTPLNQRSGYETYQSTNQIVGAGPNSMVNTIDNRYEGLKGTPYFLPDWLKGQVEMTTGKNYTNVPLKFNAHKQQLILLRTGSGNDSIIVDANQVKRFTLAGNDGQSYLFERLPTAKTNDQALKDGYFLVLYEGKNALLKRIAKTVKVADYKNPYASDVRYDAYQNAFSYYLLKPDQTLTKVKLSDKSIIDALGDRKDELKAFSKQENLTFKTDSDAVMLVKKYDSL